MDSFPGWVRHFVLAAFAVSLFVVAVDAQTPRFNFTPSPGVAPSEANHFVETPKGWVHPKTPWGQPTLGYRTRKKNKQSSAMIVRGRRRGKKKR